VRHFNFFNYHKEFETPENEIAKMKYNPQVTVRSRGVMEKCTYCVQRIQAAKIAAKNTGGAIRDGQIQTACQQACPTGAIVFGDLADRNSEVLRLHRSSRAYALLAELNIRPRTIYLAQIRNPNPELKSTDDKHGRPTV
jgi:molybdopterin-containing oxidoreductase family iron-sulfur binding subunit